ncbi:MAG: hypothetical protein EOP54_06305 [Sphingobacteriales bacterium]|nr:MAG: hypothetical protein EOP54_06305 [Sphingobacteriales bacterium]
MRVALQVWFIAAIAECLLYSIFEESVMGLFILPFALAGGLPGMFMFFFLLEAIDSLWERGRAKWIAIYCAALACANGTLVLFLLVMHLRFDELPFFAILNAATVIALALSWKKINKLHFAQKQVLIDAEQSDVVYEFKNIPDEN